MNTVWIVLVVGAAGAIILLAGSWFRRSEDFDLGTVSHQWIAEQKFGGHDQHR